MNAGMLLAVLPFIDSEMELSISCGDVRKVVDSSSLFGRNAHWTVTVVSRIGGGNDVISIKIVGMRLFS